MEPIVSTPAVNDVDKMTYAQFRAWYMDQLLAKLLEEKNLEGIKSLMQGNIEIVVTCLGKQVTIVETTPAPSARTSSSSNPRFKVGDQIKWGNNPNLYEVTESGLKNLADGTICKPSHASLAEMAVEQNVSLDFLKAKYPKGVSGISNPKWHLA